MLSLFRKKKEETYEITLLSVYCPLKGQIVNTEETALARKRHDKHFPASKHTHTTIEKLLYAVFSSRHVLFQIVSIEAKVRDLFYPELLVVLSFKISLFQVEVAVKLVFEKCPI
jgi:hypothetical protein